MSLDELSVVYLKRFQREVNQLISLGMKLAFQIAQLPTVSLRVMKICSIFVETSLETVQYSRGFFELSLTW